MLANVAADPPHTNGSAALANPPFVSGILLDIYIYKGAGEVGIGVYGIVLVSRQLLRLLLGHDLGSWNVRSVMY